MVHSDHYEGIVQLSALSVPSTITRPWFSVWRVFISSSVTHYVLFLKVDNSSFIIFLIFIHISSMNLRISLAMRFYTIVTIFYGIHCTLSNCNCIRILQRAFVIRYSIMKNWHLVAIIVGFLRCADINWWWYCRCKRINTICIRWCHIWDGGSNGCARLLLW